MILRTFNALILASCFLWLMGLHRSLITFVYPMELSEGSMVMSTRLIMQGENPWALKRQPQANNVYGALYNFVAAGVGRALHTATLASHRALSGFFIALNCLLIFFAARRLGSGRLEAGWLALLQYACLLHYTSPLARPDAQGMFLYLAAILLPLVLENRPRTWVASGLLVCLAALTKLYFVAAFPFLFLYLAWQRRWADLAWFSSAFVAGAALSGWAMATFGDTYLYAAFLGNFSQDIEYHGAYVRAQLWIYGFRYFIVLLPLFAGLGWMAFKRSSAAAALPWLFFSAVSLLVFILKLGGHYGSFLVYLFHLNLPFMLLALAALLAALPRRPWAVWVMALQALVLIPRVTLARPDSDPRVMATFQAVEGEAAKCRRLFAPWELACWQMDHGREVQDAGHRAYFVPGLLAAKRWPGLFPRVAELEGQVKIVEDNENRDLEAGAYDLVLLDQGDLRRQGLLKKKYRLLGGVLLPYPQGMALERLQAYQLRGH